MITSISNSETEEIILQYRNNRSVERLTLEQFKSLSAPREPDPDDTEEVKEYAAAIAQFQEIKMANILIPNDLCKRGIQIIDTPGTNDLDVAREEITLSFVPKSDAVIVVLSATMPFTADEAQFIKDRILSEHISKVFVILNRIDQIKEEDRAKLLKYTTEKLVTILPNVKVYPISSKDALTIKMAEKGLPFKNTKQKFFTLEDTGLAVFENDLSHFLQHEKGRVKLARHSKKLNHSIIELINTNIRVRIVALDSEIEDINKKIDSLRPQINRYRQQTTTIVQELRNGLKSEETALFYEFEREIKGLFQKVSDSLTEYSGSLNDKNEIQIYLRRQLVNEEESLKKRLADLKKKVLDQHLTVAFKKLTDEERMMNDAIYTTFNIPVGKNTKLSLNFDTFEEEMMVGLAAAGAIGVGLMGVILAPFLLFLAAPLTAIGIKLGIPAAAFIWGYFRERKIEKIQKALKENFNKEFYSMRSNLKAEWDTTLVEVDRIFNSEVNKKIEQVEENLHQIRLESVKSKEEREKIKQQLMQKQYQLTNIQLSLQSFIKGVPVS